MDKKLNEYVSIYKAQLEIGDIQIAYKQLVKYVMAIKAYFEKEFSNKYSYGSISPGYMDFTYFPFFDDFLRSRKLRLGIVLNHGKMRFELWLMGQNAEVQKRYWSLLKSTEWNRDQPTMPKYSVLEVVLVEESDFDDLNRITTEIAKQAVLFTEEIESYIKSIDK